MHKGKKYMLPKHLNASAQQWVKYTAHFW